jgi:hypothetical protein
MSPGPKNGLERHLERRPSRFSTICVKNHVLKLNIDKVTVILDTQITLTAALPMALSTLLYCPFAFLAHRLSPQRRVIENAVTAFLFNTKPECAEKVCYCFLY